MYMYVRLDSDYHSFQSSKTDLYPPTHSFFFVSIWFLTSLLVVALGVYCRSVLVQDIQQERILLF